jgi:hypothetical protein
MKLRFAHVVGFLVAVAMGSVIFTAPELSAEEAAQAPAARTLTREQVDEEYAYTVGKLAYVWGWPAVNLHNRRESSRPIPRSFIQGAIPAAPVNRITMLVDYIRPDERAIVTPNQDTVYGQGFADLGQDAVIMELPDFGGRYWVMQIMDAYTDVFAAPSSRTKSRPGFYLLAGPEWKGAVPPGVVEVIRSPTNLAWYILRIFMNDTSEDRRLIRPLVNQVAVYPAREFTGEKKITDWAALPHVPDDVKGPAEQAWVVDNRFWDDLSAVLADEKPRAGEKALTESFKALLNRRASDPAVKRGMDRAVRDGRSVVDAGIMYGSVGAPFGNGWSGALNGGNFGADYLTRALAAKAYIAVNNAADAFYLGTDVDGDGSRLDGGKGRYTLTFPKGQLPPAKAFWSLTMYNSEHFFHANAEGRYSLGTKNRDLKFNPDGSLTLYLQSDSPGKEKDTNWLPAPGAPFSVLIRAYGPAPSVLNRGYAPPPVVKVK